MYFVHPQIKSKELPKAFFYFFKKPNLEKIKSSLSFYFPQKEIYFVDMARTAFRIVIEKLGLRNSEILMPAFICDIFFPILKENQIKPIFLDIDLSTFNLNIDEIEKKITAKTKAILVCHTFGLPLDLEKLFLKLRALNSKIFIIEDCAQAFGAKYKGKPLGNFGIASFFSLYKQLPIARGGILVCPKDWKINLKETKFSFRDLISFLNSISFFAFLFKKFGGKVAPKIKRKEKGKDFFALNNASLSLFSLFFENFEKNLEKRRKIAVFFQEKLKELGFEVQEPKNNVFCYLSALVPKKLEKERDKIVKLLQKNNVFCTRIWKDPIILNQETKKIWKIKELDFPNTLEAAKRIINFPLQSYFEEKDIEKIFLTLKKVLKNLK